MDILVPHCDTQKMGHSSLNSEEDLEPLHKKTAETSSSEPLAPPRPAFSIWPNTVQRRASRRSRRNWTIPSFRASTTVERLLDNFPKRISLRMILGHVPPPYDPHGTAESLGMSGCLFFFSVWITRKVSEADQTWIKKMTDKNGNQPDPSTSPLHQWHLSPSVVPSNRLAFPLSYHQLMATFMALMLTSSGLEVVFCWRQPFLNLFWRPWVCYSGGKWYVATCNQSPSKPPKPLGKKGGYSYMLAGTSNMPSSEGI